MSLFFDAIYLISNNPCDTKIKILQQLTSRRVEVVKYGRNESHKTSAHLSCLIKSHKKKYTNYFVVEDDTDIGQYVFKQIKKFIASELPWDVLIIDGDFNQRTTTKYRCIYQILETSRLSSYVITLSFYSTLIKNIPEETYDVGMLWNHIQHQSSWYMIDGTKEHTNATAIETGKKTKHRLMNIRNRHNPSTQIEVTVEVNMMSDDELSELSEVEDVEEIEDVEGPYEIDIFKPTNVSDDVDTSKCLESDSELELELEPPLFFLAIRSTRASLETTKKQRLFKFRRFESTFTNMIYYHFIGNPSQTETYIVDEEKRLVSIKCGDDILNYQHKAYHIFKFVLERYPNVTGIYYVHDHIDLNLQELSDTLHKNKTLQYYGKDLVTINQNNSKRFIHKLRNIRDIYDENYPLIRTHPILLECSYLTEDGIYLSNECLKLLLECGNTMLAPMPSPTTFARYIVHCPLKNPLHKKMYKAIPILDDYSIAYILWKSGILPKVL